jgi:hypothetical protein
MDLGFRGYITYYGYQLWDPLLHKYDFNYRTRMVWLPWLADLTLNNQRLTGASFASTSEVWNSAILDWLKLRV